MVAFRKRIYLAGLLLGSLGFVVFSAVNSPAAEPKNETADLARYYGFRPVELYKLEKRSANLLSADLNNDRRTDLILVDNSNSRLDFLQQLAEVKKTGTPAPGSSRINFIGNDGRFEHRKISVDKMVASLTTGDLNGDGLNDLAYFGDADRLVIRFQGKSGGWQAKQRFRLPDVQTARWNLAAGDLNGDGKDDLAVLGKTRTYLIYQTGDGKMAAPQSVMNTSDKISMAQITDLDGDGRQDLCYLTNDEGDRPLCARLQDAAGRLGPEFRFEVSNPRALTLKNLDGRPGSEILTIESRTGRVKVHGVVRPKPQEGELAGRLIHYGFGSDGSGRNTDLDIGDVNGDGLTDVVVTDPTGAQIIVLLQHQESGLDQGQVFPSLIDAQQVRVGDLDGDGRSEVIVLSAKEKAIGISRMKEGRLTFPAILPQSDVPTAIELADLNQDGRLEIVCLSSEKKTGSKYTLHAISLGPDGQWSAHPFGAQEKIELTFKSKPKRLTQLDANADGKIDFLIFTEAGPALLLTNKEGVPELSEQRGGLGLGKVTSGAVFPRATGESGLLVAQQNFARNMSVDAEGRWQVVDQYNAAESKAKIVGAAEIDLDNKPGQEIVLVDTGVKKLRVLRKEENLFRPWREVEMGEFRYKSTHVADLNGDGRADLLLFGAGRFGVLYAGQTDPQLSEIASYETKLDKARFADIVAGDLNGDGYPDVACIDTKTQLIDILDFAPKTGLRHALYFKVYEAKSLVADEKTGTDPREAIIADVTGDGRNDLILLCHDRVLVYPQDPGGE